MLLTINTLTANDDDSFKRTLKIILERKIACQIHLLFADESKENNQKYRKNKIANLIAKKLQNVSQIIMMGKKENGIYYLLQNFNLKQLI